MQKIEYLEVKIPAASFSEKLSELGMDGWDLCHRDNLTMSGTFSLTSGTSRDTYEHYYTCILSRPFTPLTIEKEVD